MSLTRP